MNDSISTLNLVKHYFNICNTALSQRKDDALYAPVLSVLNQFASGETIRLKVIGADGKVMGWYTTRYVDGEFTPIMEGKQGDPDARFTLKRSFLQNVMSNADEYIKHPQKLDWSWLTDN